MIKVCADDRSCADDTACDDDTNLFLRDNESVIKCNKTKLKLYRMRKKLLNFFNISRKV